MPSSAGRFEIAANAVAGGSTFANGSAEFLVQGADLERSNVVCHYQNTPFYANVPHVSRVQPYAQAFPFLDK